MEISQPDIFDNLFFHHQRNPVRQYRRVRKEPEDLPQALRYFKYANLNPRIAAFLGKQDPKSLLKRAKSQGNKPDGKESGAVAPNGGVEAISGEFGNDLSREARSLLPDIGRGFNKLNLFGDENFHQSRLSFNNETEDPLRYQFEETTFAAPNILRELSDTLNKFNTCFKEYSQRATLYDPDTGDPIATNQNSPSVLLPANVRELLCHGWSDLTADAVYTPRNWQSAMYHAGHKYAATLASGKHETTPAIKTVPLKVSDATSDKKAPTNTSGGLKSIVDLLEEVGSKSRTKGESSEIRAASKKGKVPSKDLLQLAIALPALAAPKQDGGIKKTKTETKPKLARNAQKVTSARGLLSTALEQEKRRKYKQIRKMEQGGKWLGVKGSKLDPIEEDREIARKEGQFKSNTSIVPGEIGGDKPGRANNMISFNLSSKRAYEEGWIHKPQIDADLQENNLLEWATGRLQTAIKQKEEEDEHAKLSGCDKQVIVRHYGDSRRDTLMKLYRKGTDTDNRGIAAPFIPGKRTGNVPKIPQLSKLDSDQRERFMIQLPDGSASVYYPKTSELAIMASAVPNEPGQLYVNCYANDQDKTCLATFTPYGQSCCYHKNGVPGLILTDKGGLIKSEDGSVLNKWTWPPGDGKLKDSVTFQINKEMNVRVNGKHNAQLHFSANRESFKIPVGAQPGVKGPKDLIAFNSSIMLGDKVDSYHGKKSLKRLRSLHSRKTQSLSKKPSDLEALRQSLDPPERFEFDSQADRELLRLMDKSRHLIDDWMDHYRFTIGITSPALKKILDRPVIKSPKRRVQSAKERRIVNEEDEEFDEKGTRYQSFRSPSAPPRHMIPGPHSLTVEDTRPKPATPQTKKHFDLQRVRIDETHSVLAAVEEYRSDITITPTRTPPKDTRTRPATQSTRSPHRGYRSILRTASSANASISQPQPQPSTTWNRECDGCPVAAKRKLLNQEKKEEVDSRTYVCKCSKHRIPVIGDVEYDYFLHKVVPSSQLIVVCVVNSLHPNANPYDDMLDRVYNEKHKNRTHPCRQCRHDQYRLLRYDLATATLDSKRSTPLLLGRHNVVPGMTLMYCGGRLVFADHIFNGYGNARQDFRKQIFKSRQEYLVGRCLPDDFRFTPARGKSGARAAWGGEMRGAGIDGKGQPGMIIKNTGIPKSKSAGARIMTQTSLIATSQSSSNSTSISSLDFRVPPSKSFDTARDFVQYSLSTRNYVVPSPERKFVSPVKPVPVVEVESIQQITSPSRYMKRRGLRSSIASSDSSLRQVSQISTFGRMQAVK